MSRFITVKEVIQKTSLSRATIWRMVRKGDFPQNVRISFGRVAWLESDIDSWMHSKYTRQFGPQV